MMMSAKQTYTFTAIVLIITDSIKISMKRWIYEKDNKQITFYDFKFDKCNMHLKTKKSISSIKRSWL